MLSVHVRPSPLAAGQSPTSVHPPAVQLSPIALYCSLFVVRRSPLSALLAVMCPVLTTHCFMLGGHRLIFFVRSFEFVAGFALLPASRCITLFVGSPLLLAARGPPPVVGRLLVVVCCLHPAARRSLVVDRFVLMLAACRLLAVVRPPLLAAFCPPIAAQIFTSCEPCGGILSM